LNPLRRDRQYCVSDGEQLAARRLLSLYLGLTF
jgi:hypothetical protein